MGGTYTKLHHAADNRVETFPAKRLVQYSLANAADFVAMLAEPILHGLRLVGRRQRAAGNADKLVLHIAVRFGCDTRGRFEKRKVDVKAALVNLLIEYPERLLGID